MINNCINTSSLEYKNLLDQSGLSAPELNYYIRKFQEKMNNLEAFPPLEVLLNIKDTTYYNKDSIDSIKDLFDGALKDKNKKERLFQVTQENVQKVINKLGLTGTSVELVQYINNRYPDVRFERKTVISKGVSPYVLFKMESMATINNKKKVPKYMDQSSLLSGLVTEENYTPTVSEPIFVIGDWNVIPYKNKYVVSKGIPTSYSELAYLNKYNESEAINKATINFNTDESFTTNVYKDLITNRSKLDDLFYTNAKQISVNGYSQRIKLNNIEVYNFDSPDYKLDTSLEIPMQIRNGEVFIKPNISREQVFDSIRGNNQSEQYVYSQLVKNGYDIGNLQNILDTNDKLLTFQLLKAKYYLDNLEVYERVSKIANIKARGAIDIDASLYALNFIRSNDSIKLKVTKNNDYAVFTKINESGLNFVNNSKVNNDNSSNMVYLLDKLSELYGFKYNLVTTYELSRPEWQGLIENPEIRNAFIYNGQIYINTDNASLDAPIHELTHLILGSIKSKKPQLYYNIVNKIYSLPDYDVRSKRYNNLVESDKNEEIFTEIFSDYISKTLLRTDVNNWLFENSGDFNILNYEYKRVLDELIDPDNSTTKDISSRLQSMSLNEVMNEFGSSLRLGKFSDILDNDMAQSTRQLSNLKNRLLKENKLKENCY